MIDNILFSIAGKKRNEQINLLIDSMLSHKSISRVDKTALEYTKKVAEEGTYPDKKYYQEQGYEAVRLTKSISELKVQVKEVLENWTFEELRRQVITTINESETLSQLQSGISRLKEENYEQSSLDDYLTELKPVEKVEKGEGYCLSVDEIDSVTGLFRCGTLVSLCAFTSHGKSTLAISSAYKNLKQGKSGVLFSLELSPEIVLNQFYSRWLYEEKSLEITPNSMTDGSLSEEQQLLVEKYKQDFNSFIKGKLIVVDEAILTKTMMSDFRELSNLYKTIETKIDSVDFVIYDHINQVELMFEGLGNTFVRTITSATKTFVNKKGNKPVTLMCVQTNRQGVTRAQRRDGKYDLQAISDLNEIERSSFYVVFMYSSEDMRLLQETKLTLLKHRGGALVTEPVTVAFNPATFVVGEIVETVSFLGNMSFLNETTESYTADDFEDF